MQLSSITPTVNYTEEDMNSTMFSRASKSFFDKVDQSGKLLTKACNSANKVAKSTIDSVKDIGLHQVRNFARFAVGMNNISNAYKEATTNEKKYSVVELPNKQYKIKATTLSFVDRARSVSGELTIGAAKIVGWSMFAHGGICKAGIALGMMDSCHPLSISGVNQALFTGTTKLAAFTASTGLFVAEKAIIPAVSFVAEKVLNNSVNSAALAAIGAALYCAAKDVTAISIPPSVKIQGGKAILDASKCPTFFGKVKLGTTATLKVALAAGVAFYAIGYNK